MSAIVPIPAPRVLYHNESTGREENPAEDQSLERTIAQIQQGRQERYVEVVRVYQQAMYRYCLRLLGHRQDAEDAVQDIFVKAFEAIPRYRYTTGFSSWLYAIAHRHCLNQLRNRNRQTRLLQRLFGSVPSAESPEQAMDSKLFSPPLMSAMAALSPEERSVIILRVFEERTYEELGAILGCKPEAAKKRFNRARMKVQRKWDKRREESGWNENDQSMHAKI